MSEFEGEFEEGKIGVLKEVFKISVDHQGSRENKVIMG